MKDIQRRLGQRIKELRVQQGFQSQEELSEFLGVHRTVIGFWETGCKDLRLSTLVKISEALGVPLGQLLAGLEGTGPAPSQSPRSLDRDRLLRDIAILEDQVQKLKATVSTGRNDPTKKSSVKRRPKTK